jgi:hypothetical protein
VQSLEVEKTLLSWSPGPEATGYDVVQGDLEMLIGSGGDFTTATTACLDDNRPHTTLPISGTPPTGHGLWFLVRGMNCAANGTYDTGSSSQVASRDGAIDASSGACP